MTQFLLHSLQGIPRPSATVLEEWTRRCLRFLPVLLWILVISWISIPSCIIGIFLASFCWQHSPQGVLCLFGFCPCKVSSYRSQNTSPSRKSHKLSEHLKGFAHTFADAPQPPRVNLPTGYRSTWCNSQSTFLVSLIALRIDSFSCSNIYKQAV